ncbi:MAG: pyruvate carboxylase subunit B [Terrimicrobiaceae bacterium]|nr:pyruvate carboxylase subunit B [Terrimicrobiaceae bacterium]
MKPIVFNNTVLRDGHQSLAATRMTTAQMLPAAPILDACGFGGLETWGGATIDSCLRFLHENPFDRLRALKSAAPKTPQIMLLRGQNIVQYTAFPDDVVRAFVKATCDAGCDVLRIFDALNDVRNLETAIDETRKCGHHARGEICYTTSPVHTVESFIELGIKFADMGCHSIGIKDMAGILAPHVCYELVSGLKKAVNLPVTVHSHDTAGLAATTYYAAVEAGADAIETSITPFANGTSQPDTVRMIAMLEHHPRRVTYDTRLLAQLREHFSKVYEELSAFTSHANEVVDSDTLCYQVPGGMLSNFRNQLKDQKMLDRFEEVMLEIPHVRQCLGWIPLVTPTSQIVGTQAMLNVKFGRWKTFAPAAMDIALGKYGRTPGPIDPEVLAIAKKNTGSEPVEGRLADALEPRMPALRAELEKKGLPVNDENAVLFAMFPQELEKLYKSPAPAPAAMPAPKPTPAAEPTPAGSQRFRLTIGGRTTEALVEEIK